MVTLKIYKATRSAIRYTVLSLHTIFVTPESNTHTRIYIHTHFVYIIKLMCHL